MIPTIHYILRHERPTPDGSAAIYMRIAFNRQQHVTLAMGRNIPLKKEFQSYSVEQIKQIPTEARYNLYCWDQHKERATKGFGTVESLNFYLP